MQKTKDLIDVAEENDETFVVKDLGFIFAENIQVEKRGFFKRVFGKRPLLARKIHFSGEVYPTIRVPNVIRNQKYNIITFVPVVLINQFKFFSNMFFLLNALSQFIRVFQTGNTVLLKFTKELRISNYICWSISISAITDNV